MNKFFCLFAVALILGSCAKDDTPEPPPGADTTPNILLIIADDLGKDALNGFSEGSIKPNTPNIDAIRNAGLSFNNLWVYPTCTPTRASIITGKYGYRTDVKWASDKLDESEVVLQKFISDETNAGYASALVGKWHLSGSNATANPETFGIDYYAGLIRGSVEDYYQWPFTEDGIRDEQNTYATEFFTDLAIDWVNEQSKPWFLWLAYNAPHTPFHVPPGDMHNQGNLPDYVDGIDATPYYMAAIEAMDFQIGRLLENIPEEEKENTVIIFLGDNGSPIQVAQAPYSSATSKGSLFQGGINVPMFVSGKGVTRTGADDNLITSTDLFATIAQLAGASTDQIHDSKSFKSLFSQSSTIRKFQYTEMDDGSTDAWAISDAVYKLIVNANGSEEMYHVGNDPYERTNLLTGSLSASESNAKTELEEELGKIRQ